MHSYHHDRADGYGGVLVGVKSNIISNLIDVPSDLKVCTVLIHSLWSPYSLLFCVYRPPNTDALHLTN